MRQVLVFLSVRALASHERPVGEERKYIALFSHVTTSKLVSLDMSAHL
jgi:hypothetical protein